MKKQMNDIRDKKIITTIILLSLAILSLVWICFFWQLKNVKKTTEEYQKEKLNAFVLQEKERKLAQLKEELSNLGEQEKRFEKMFVNEKESLPFLRALEKVATETNCSITVNPVEVAKIKFEKAKKVEKPEKSEKKDDLAGLKEYPAFTIEATGTFPEVTNFLRKAENLPYFLRVLTLDLAVHSAKGKSSTGEGVLPSAQNGNQNTTTVEKEHMVKLVFSAVIYGK